VERIKAQKMKSVVQHSIIMALATLCFSQASAQTLDEYVTEAAANNAGLKATFLLYQAALEKVPQVGALPDPQFSFGYFISPVETRVGAQRMTISAKQMFPWFGSLDAKKSVAAEYAKAQFEVFEANRKKLVWKVSEPYLNLYTIQEKERVQQSNIAILKSYERLALQRFEQGQGSMIDVLRVQLEISEQETMLQLLTNKKEPLILMFNQLLNRAIKAPINLPDTLELSPLLWSDSIILDSVLFDNPVLAELASKQRALNYQATVVRKQGAPSVGIGLNYILVSERTDVDIPDNGKDILLPMLTLRIPLYRGKYKAQLKETNLRLEALKQTEIEKRYHISSAVSLTVSDYRDAEARILLYQSQQVKVRRILLLLVESYAVDGKNFEEVLRLQQLLLVYENRKIEATRDLHLANSNLKSL
jgi:cobalt-zinc-cadmium efflux system outer membrane protein